MNADTTELVTPIVHLNGTPLENLIRERCDVYNALTDALDALKQMGPNGRDYFPEPGRLELALAQHQRRGQILRDLQNEIKAEMDAIYESTP